jgi:UPF0755 protein
MKRMIFSLLFFLTLGSGGGIYILWGAGGILSSGPHGHDVIVNIEKGSNLASMAHDLAKGGALEHPWGFVAAAFLTGKKSELKAGEYLIPAHARPIDIVHLLASGKVIIHQVTIPEGLTVRQIIEVLKADPNLTGEIMILPEEGTLLPETYVYLLGESREKMLAQMQQAMIRALEATWKNRRQTTPLQTPNDLLVLASIVEKETGVPEERPQVAAVFLNRLKTGMKLQSDPTVIYGLTLGEKPLGRLLTLNDLKHQSPYNTYVIPALPPKPIACPGRKSLEAVINPSSSKDLYFVANGTGGHTFSATYDKHTQNVKEWRKIQKRK